MPDVKPEEVSVKKGDVEEASYVRRTWDVFCKELKGGVSRREAFVSTGGGAVSVKSGRDRVSKDIDTVLPLPPEVATKPRSAEEKKESRKKMTKLRSVISKRLVEVQNSSAMLTTFNEIDMTAVLKVRKLYKEQFKKRHGIKLGFMSFFVKAVVSALQTVPAINAYVDDKEIVQREYYDIGIAVAMEKGLVVPVVRNCETLSFADIEKAIAYYALKAREGGLSVDELQGGSFTITNGGVFGSLLSTPILNPPQSGILGMHSIVDRPIAIRGKVEARPMMYIALTYDHRIVDGKEAVTFLKHIKEMLETPSSLLLDL